MTGNIYDTPAAALDRSLFDGMTIMSGGFGLPAVSNNAGVDATVSERMAA